MPPYCNGFFEPYIVWIILDDTYKQATTTGQCGLETRLAGSSLVDAFKTLAPNSIPPPAKGPRLHVPADSFMLVLHAASNGSLSCQFILHTPYSTRKDPCGRAIYDVGGALHSFSQPLHAN